MSVLAPLTFTKKEWETLADELDTRDGADLELGFALTERLKPYATDSDLTLIAFDFPVSERKTVLAAVRRLGFRL